MSNSLNPERQVIRVYGDRPLKTLPGLATRPTPSRVREALFNIWQGRVAGCRWLDICTGSGAMMAESLLRGASLAVGIEQSGAACKLIQENLQRLTPKLSPEAILEATPTRTWQIHRGDVLKVLPRLLPQQFDLIYCDPPYQSDLYDPILALLPLLLASDGAAAIECDRGRQFPPAIASEGITIRQCDRRIYGQTAIAFYEIVPPA